MNLVSKVASRRTLLRGVLQGSAVSVALPFLDCFLNNSGTALAATGAPVPVRFATWFWGCGMIPGRWEPEKVGAGYEITEQLKPLKEFKSRMNVISGMKVSLDGNVLVPHVTGQRGCIAGDVTKQAVLPSVDTLIADVIGADTRFRSLEVSATGNPAHTISRRSSTVINPSEGAPVALYTRLFGPDFRDPNAAEFKPDPRVMVRKSVLSAIKEPREALARNLGAADRARLDEYFTSLRQIENQVALQLEKPVPLESCSEPEKPDESDVGTDVSIAATNHKLMAALMAHAVACDQTRVLNVSFTDGASSLRRSGDTTTQHIVTHEEPFDDKLGYQVKVNWFIEQIMQGFATFLTTMDGIREGDGTLLDRMLVFGLSECGFAKQHTLENMPMLLVGSAAGRLKGGIHVAAKGDPVTRVGLTIQQIFGLPVSDWGAGSMHTNRTISELLA